jgi:hypothetical protein
MVDPTSAAIPPNPAQDPAADNSATFGNYNQYLQQIGVNASTAQNLLTTVQKQINTVTNVPSTVGGYLSKINDNLNAAGVSFNPYPNVLDTYSTYTYHIKFCIASDQDALKVNSLDTWTQVPKEVIAESGVTAGFNIKDFEIKNICSPQEKIGIATQVSWSMTLLEPYGMSLVDRLFTLARQMGVSDHMKCKYFIETWFNGINDDGTPTELVKHKVWRVVLRKVDADNNSSGTTYSLEGIVDGSMAHSNELGVIPSTLTVNEVSTMADFWYSFQTKLNQQLTSLDFDKINQRIEYAFVLPNGWKNWKFTRKNTDSARQSGFDFTNPDKPNVTIPGGWDIQKILISVMSMTEEGKIYTLGPTGTDGQTQQTSTKAASQGVAMIPHIQSKVEFVGYNYLYNDYVKKITFYFHDYITTRAYIDRSFIQNSEQLSVQKARLKSFISENRLAKTYYYNFTGLNTDVIKFDFKLDPYWSSLLPPYGGYNNSTVWDPAPQVNGQSAPENILNSYNKARYDLGKAQVDLKNLQNADTKDRGNDYNTKLEAAKNAVTSAENTLATFKGIDTSYYEIRFATDSAGEQSIGGIIIKNADILKSQKVQQDIASRLAYKITRSKTIGDRYLETIRPQDPSANPLPISSTITREPIQQDNSNSGEGKSEPSSTGNGQGAPKTRGLLASSLDNVMSPQFAKVELEIRGDPYWMGFDNIENLKYLDPNSKPSAQVAVQTATYGSGECGFLLFFRTGEEPNEDTGFVDFNNTSFAFNGLYVVTEVVNHFRDGEFRQTLKAIKDVAMYAAWRDLQPK